MPVLWELWTRREQESQPFEQVPSWSLWLFTGGDGHGPHSCTWVGTCPAPPAQQPWGSHPYLHCPEKIRSGQTKATASPLSILRSLDAAPGSAQALPIPRGHRSRSQDPMQSSSVSITSTGDILQGPSWPPDQPRPPGPTCSPGKTHSKAPGSDPQPRTGLLPPSSGACCILTRCIPTLCLLQSIPGE